LEQPTPIGPAIGNDPYVIPQQNILGPDRVFYKPTDQEIKDAFFTFDMSGNGFVGHSEIKFVLDALKANATDAEIDEMIRIVDMNKDNQVEYKEFWRMAAGETLEPVSKLVW